ncbi:MAG: MMPL family transporter, partial [Deltaproteobacteria bacterium]|nr:MMPL family transporter [Deltaproteobacteria bacterium]
YALWIQGIPFDSNLLNLQAKGTEAVAYEKKLSSSDLSPRSAVLLVKQQEEAKKIVEALNKLPTVKKVSWLGEVLPKTWTPEREALAQKLKSYSIPKTSKLDPSLLQKNLKQLENLLNQSLESLLSAPNSQELLSLLEKNLSELEFIQKNLNQVSDENLAKFNQAFITVYRDHLLKAAHSPLAKKSDIAPQLLRQVESPDGTLALQAYPSVNIWEREALESFTKQLQSISPNFTGPPMMFYEILNLVRSSYFLAGLLSAAAIFILFLINFRSLKYSLLAMAPLVFGVFSLFGLMNLMGLSFNTANLIALPMILGIGADNGVHLLQRFRQEGERTVDFLLGSTGKALLLTYLDTLTSFLGMALARHQGLASLGQIVLIGITCSTIMGLIFLPPVLLRLSKKN